MTETWETELRQAAARTFEELAFLMPVPEEASSGDAYAAGASVAFSGPMTGRLELRVCPLLLPVLAANMLGDEAPSEAQQHDALGEIANIVCGNVLPAIGGREAVFRLDAPRAIAPSAGEAPAARVRMPLDAGRAEVRLYVEREPARAGEGGA